MLANTALLTSCLMGSEALLLVTIIRVFWLLYPAQLGFGSSEVAPVDASDVERMSFLQAFVGDHRRYKHRDDHAEPGRGVRGPRAVPRTGEPDPGKLRHCRGQHRAVRGHGGHGHIRIDRLDRHCAFRGF